jgi:hypothetical protein
MGIISTFCNSISKIGQGFKEEGLLGAVKAIGKGLSDNWLLSTLACCIPGVGAVLLPLTLAATAADCLGACDLKSDKAAAKASEQQPQAQAQPA